MSKPTADEIEAARALAAAVAEDLPVGVWVARAPSGEFLYANHRFQEIMGTAARDDVAAGEYAAPYGICDRDGNPYPEERMPFVQALRAGTTVTVDDIVIRRPDGGRAYIRAFARPVTDAAGAITHVIIAFIDITREAEAERARAESERRLRHAQRMEAIGNLAGGVAHDFNNLLAGLKLLAGSLKSGERDPDRRATFDTIDELIERAAGMTRGLLGFAGRGAHRPAPVGLNPLVTGLVDIFRRTLLGVAAIETRLTAPGDGVVIGDASQLEQVVMNLVVNARDALAASGTHGHIVVATRTVEVAAGEAAEVAPGRWQVLEVIDDGPGIPPALRERVFEPYFTTRIDGPAPGSGLGLATAFGAVERHGGRITIHDAPGGHGALMRVYLPAAAAEPARLSRVTTPQVATGSGEVLIVDDEPLVRASMARVLRLAGYQVTEAGSGVDAIELFRRAPDRFRVVILDMVMPRMGGRATFEALQAIRGDVSVLAVSGYDANDDIQPMLAAGARGFLAKPCSIQDLTGAVAGILVADAAREGRQG